PIIELGKNFGRGLLTVGSVSLILFATLYPMEPPVEPQPLCLLCGRILPLDVFLNITLFFPLGLALASIGQPLSRGLIYAFLLSATVESLQVSVTPGRDPNLVDVVSNTLGALLGGRILTLLRGGAQRRRAR